MIEVDIAGSKVEGMDIRGYVTLNGEQIEWNKGKLMMPGQSICVLK